MATHEPLIERPKTSLCKTLSLVLISFAAVISTTLFAIHSIKTTSFTNSTLSFPPHICDQSIEKESCLAMVLETVRGLSTTTVNEVDHHDILKTFLEKTTSKIQEALRMAKFVSRRINNNPKDRAALLDCAELMDLSRDRVMDSIVTLYLQNLTYHSHEDAHAWLSGVLTNHVTCLDGLEEGSFIRTTLEPKLKELISRARTSLAILVSVLPSKSEAIEPLNGDFPTWVKAGDRRLLQALAKDIKADIVVAKDGSGKYKTVKEAVAAVPDKSTSRFVIYVKKGVYKETVEVGKNKKNVMLVGDGMDSTIITGSLNVVDGSTTFNSATIGNY
ncbi:Pectinesterase inhibitor domain containing protein [Parasponia andersonii]|uniref:Pectinesterase n=1 Tax=Parasponia andersonii TaxID=3476 RepID=A0A2P5A3S4_PARAD|nr:Pectinesterase inhibitor domain containing protein [Parasponia andersonii]